MRVSGLWVCALGVALCLTAACFGDNSDGDGDGPVGAPSVLEISSSVEEADPGDVIDLTVKVKGKANEQLSVAVDATLGTVTPQNKVVITDDNGDAVFQTKYTSGAAGGQETITANVSLFGTAGKSLTKALTIFEVERFGNTAPLDVTPVAEAADYLVAYPFVVQPPRTLRKVGIVAPAAATVLVGLYNSNEAIPAKPTNALARVTATLVAGVNEIPLPMNLTAGRYWMVVCYSGTPMVYKKTLPVPIAGWSIQGHMFSSGLPDTLGVALQANLGDRNFYLVLRK